MTHMMSIRLVAIVFSLVLHGVWFVQAGGQIGVVQQAQATSQQVVSRVTFSAPPTNIDRVEQPRVEQIPKPREKPKPKTSEKKVLKPKPEELVVKRETKPIEQPAVQASAKPAALVEQLSINEGMLKQEKERYLAEMMAYIEKHKMYPKSAQRRGIQGEVQVSFTLLADGSVQQVEATHGPKVLRLAAEKAVFKAKQMPKPPAAINCPLQCEFSMVYALN